MIFLVKCGGIFNFYNYFHVRLKALNGVIAGGIVGFYFLMGDIVKINGNHRQLLSWRDLETLK